MISGLILESNPVSLRNYLLPKVHKESTHIRLVVSFISASLFKLSKFLDLWCRRLIKLQSDFLVKNFIELVEKVRDTCVLPPGKLSWSPSMWEVYFWVSSSNPHLSIYVSYSFVTTCRCPESTNSWSFLSNVSPQTILSFNILFTNFLKTSKSLLARPSTPWSLKWNVWKWGFRFCLPSPLSYCILVPLCGWWLVSLELVHYPAPQLPSSLNSLYPTIDFTIEIGGESLEITIVNGTYSFGIFRKDTHQLPEQSPPLRPTFLRKLAF